MRIRPPREDLEPWYRQFWPWFLIALPASAVVASLVTISLAVNSRNDLVHDDYYKKGLAIHKDAAQTKLARELGLAADLHYVFEPATLELHLNHAAVEDLSSLRLAISHPTLNHLDRQLVLQRTAPGIYFATTESLKAANWRLSVEPPNGLWRISGRIEIPRQVRTQLN